MRRLLVANRGEIALRIFRACRAEGIETVAVAAPDDRGALHAESADALVEISSYLDPAEHVRAARESGADSVHPGYGFLSESAELAEAVLEAGLTWVGPPPSALRAGGDKLAAKETAREAGVPVLPSGTPEEIGFPLLVKAAAGGGGRGMRIVRVPEELEEALAAARREAAAAFGDDSVFCERYLERPATSRSSSLPTGTATSRRSASATARSSAATRRCSRRHRPPRSTPSCARR